MSRDLCSCLELCSEWKSCLENDLSKVGKVNFSKKGRNRQKTTSERGCKFLFKSGHCFAS